MNLEKSSSGECGLFETRCQVTNREIADGESIDNGG
jgi:hypothetical protein